MIREIAGYERKRSFKIKKQEEETALWRSAGLISLCLDSGGKAGECGELHHLYGEKSIAFSSLFEAVNQMEALYDAASFPQASTRLRSFLKDRGTERTVPEEGKRDAASGRKEIREARVLEQLLRYRGEKATFWIRVLYRQHTSWQGEVTWVDQQKKVYFRSALELLRLLYGALCTEKREDGT